MPWDPKQGVFYTGASTSSVLGFWGSKPETHVFLLIGSNNMVGRASWDGGEGFPLDTLQVARTGGPSGGADGVIVPAQPMLDHVDVNSNKFGPSLQFAIEYVKEYPNATILFVPCADEGTGFRDNRWSRGGASLEDAITRTNTLLNANPAFLFKGILWHGSEKDCDTPANAAAFPAKLDAMINTIRSRVVGAANVPVVVGHLASTLVNNALYPEAETVNTALQQAPNRLSFAGLARRSSLTTIDDIHFDAPSMRSLGARYFSGLQEAKRDLPTPLSILAFDHGEDATTVANGGTYTFTGKVIAPGTVIITTTSRGSGNPDVSSLTVNGIAAHKLGTALGDSHANTSWVISGLTTTTATVVVTISGGNSQRMGICLWSVGNVAAGNCQAIGVVSDGPFTERMGVIESTEGGLVLAHINLVQNGQLPQVTSWLGAFPRMISTEVNLGYTHAAADLLVTRTSTVYVKALFDTVRNYPYMNLVSVAP